MPRFSGLPVTDGAAPAPRFGGTLVSSPDDQPFVPPGPVMFGAEGSPDTETTKQLLKGVVSGLVGTPGEIADLVTKVPYAQYTPIGQIAKGARNLLPTPSEVGDYLFDKPDKNHAIAREIGEFGGSVLFPGPGAFGKGAELVGKGATKVAEAAGMAVPKAVKEGAEIANIAKPSDASTLGRKMYQDLKTRYNKLSDVRATTADKYKEAYLNQPYEKEREVANAYKAYLNETQLVLDRHMTADEKKLMQELQSRLGSDPSITRVESERRYLGDISSGKVQGYEAIDKIFAGKLKRDLEKILRDRIPASGKFIDAYSEMSEPLNLFESTIGKKITKDVSPYLPDVPHGDPADLPKMVFKTKDSLERFRQLTGEDNKFVREAAGEWVSTSLMDKSASEARTWLQNNRAWLDELPTVKADTEKYVSNLEKATHTAERAEKVKSMLIRGGVIGATGAATGKATYDALRQFGVF